MPMPSVQFGEYRFAPGFWPTVAFAMLFPSLVGLGVWQAQRAGEKQLLVDRQASGVLAAPLDLSRTRSLGEADRYRPAVVGGRYLDSQQWLLDNRIHMGQPGYHVFTPFVIDGEAAPSLLVNRGWVAVGESREHLPVLPLPPGRVELRGHLDTPASVGMVLGEVPLESVDDKVRVLSLDIEALGRARGMALLPFALVIDEAMPGVLQYDWAPVPPMGPEKHLGYAVQWFGLSVALLIIYVGVNTRRNPDGGGNHVNT